MGQPTGGLTIRSGRSQLWQHTPVLLTTNRGFAEHRFKLMIGAVFAELFFQTLAVDAAFTPWVALDKKGSFVWRAQHKWGWRFGKFPLLEFNFIRDRYVENGIPKFLLFDGENAFFSLPYRHRRSRFTSIFWAQPKIVRLQSKLILLLRGYNVTEPRAPISKAPIAEIRRTIPWLLRKIDTTAEPLMWF